ncbi:MAG: DNA polymerase III subunit beta [Candidatus Kerfeldbacteria bacterium]|nr:DNA polymerase III subunit beta [Candidatus Kerfeldbacteria bacterium]
MKFSCTQENINHGLSVVGHITSRNVHLPILHNILIDAKQEGIDLVATNLEIGIRMHIRGKVETLGSFTIPAQIFSNYMNLVSSERVDVAQEDKDLVVQAGSQHTKIRGEAASEFPLIPEVEKTDSFTLPSNTLKEALKQTFFAVSHDYSRPELTGVLCVVKDRTVVFVATDSYRLTERKLTTQQPYIAAPEKKLIIPASALIELVRILPDTNEPVIVYMSDSQVLFHTNEFDMTSRLIEGAFPDYEQIIPQSEQTTVLVDRESFSKAVKAAGLFSKSGIHDVNLHFSPEQQTITITTVNNQVGENVTKVAAEITGESNSAVFNHRYLLDGLAHISTSKTKLSLIDATNPGVFRPAAEGSAVEEYLYIIMPIKQ